MSAGNQYYDFVHISDVARAFYLRGERGVDDANYVIGSGEAKPLREILCQVGAIANRAKGGEPVSLGFGEIQFNIVFLQIDAFKTDNIRRDTGFRLKVPFAEGIYRTVEWIQRTG